MITLRVSERVHNILSDYQTITMICLDTLRRRLFFTLRSVLFFSEIACAVHGMRVAKGEDTSHAMQLD